MSLTRKYDEIETLYFIDNILQSNVDRKQQLARILLTICDLEEGEAIALNQTEFDLSFMSIEDIKILQKYLDIKCEKRIEKQNNDEVGATNTIKYNVIKLKRARNPAYRRLLIEQRLETKRIISSTASSVSTTTSFEANIIMKEYRRQQELRMAETALKPIDEQIFELFISKYRPFKTIKIKIYNKNNQLVLYDPIEISVLSSAKMLVEELRRLEMSNPSLFSTSFSNANCNSNHNNDNNNIVCRILKSVSFVDVLDLNVSFLRCGVIPPSVKIQLFYE